MEAVIELGFETIGNATLICHDSSPVLVTDPWIDDTAYFGSWTKTHLIPDEQIEAIANCQFVWLSHGHPDHLSIKSLNRLKNKRILLPDHVGGRIAGELRRMEFNVTVLQDRIWTRLSPRINVLCAPDYNQDAILLVDIDGTMICNLNDAQPRGWGSLVQKSARQAKDSFLMMGFGYGDADMINFFDEEGVRIEPPLVTKQQVGRRISQVASTYGVSHVVPFRSFHKYQRTDSIWASQYSTPLDAYRFGFESASVELLPAFVRYDCTKKQFDEINPARTADTLHDPAEFGDDWSEVLELADAQKLDDYFRPVSRLGDVVDFINIRVGGEDNFIEFRKNRIRKGVMFEVPRRSLMRAARYQIFDDLMIGNFMKTTLVGKWPSSKLYPDFIPYLTTKFHLK